MSRQSSSVRDNQERISMPRAWHYTKIVMMAITFILLLTFTAYLVGVLIVTRGSAFERVLMIPFLPLEALALDLSIPIVAALFAMSVLFSALAMLYAIRTEPHFYSDEYASGMPLGRYYRNLPEPQMKIEDAMLGLWSVLKCTVSFCAPSPPPIDEDASLQETVQTVWRWVSVMTGNASRNLAIRDVISACVPDAQQAHISALGRCLEAASRETDGRQRSGGISRGAPERLEREDPEILGLAAECHRRIVDSNGRLFVSRSGLVGFGPPRTAEGDTIALLRGVAVPMVLRRAEGAGEGDGYTVVGPAYVSGLMDLTEFNTSVHGADWTAVYLV